MMWTISSEKMHPDGPNCETIAVLDRLGHLDVDWHMEGPEYEYLSHSTKHWLCSVRSKVADRFALGDVMTGQMYTVIRDSVTRCMPSTQCSMRIFDELQLYDTEHSDGLPKSWSLIESICETVLLFAEEIGHAVVSDYLGLE